MVPLSHSLGIWLSWWEVFEGKYKEHLAFDGPKVVFAKGVRLDAKDFEEFGLLLVQDAETTPKALLKRWAAQKF